MAGKNVSIRVDDGADVQLFFDRMVLFMFDSKESKTVKGHVLDVAFTEKIAIKAVCLSRYIECIIECWPECKYDEDKAEPCRNAYKECLGSPEGFSKHAQIVYRKFLDRVKEAENAG